MQLDTETDLKAVKKAPKIEISTFNENSSFSELIEADIDHESLHPSYKVRLSTSHDYLPKTDKCKVSLQIKKFLIKCSEFNDVNRRNLSPNTSTVSHEQYESKEIGGLKEKRNKKYNLCSCSSNCVIG